MAASSIDGFIRFTQGVMGAYQRGDPVAVRYRGLLERICETMLETHEIVLQRLVAVEAAAGIDGTREAVRALDADALRLAFHNEGLCDLLVGLGEGLRGLNYRVEGGYIEDDPKQSTVPGHIPAGRQLTDALTNREAELAHEYVSTIKELAELLAIDAHDSRNVRAKAAAARNRLTRQQAAFQHLASVFARRVPLGAS